MRIALSAFWLRILWLAWRDGFETCSGLEDIPLLEGEMEEHFDDWISQQTLRFEERLFSQPTEDFNNDG